MHTPATLAHLLQRRLSPTRQQDSAGIRGPPLAPLNMGYLGMRPPSQGGTGRRVGPKRGETVGAGGSGERGTAQLVPSLIEEEGRVGGESRTAPAISATPGRARVGKPATRHSTVAGGQR